MVSVMTSCRGGLDPLRRSGRTERKRVAGLEDRQARPSATRQTRALGNGHLKLSRSRSIFPKSSRMPTDSIEATAELEALRAQLALRDAALDAATTHFMIVDAVRPDLPIVYVNRALARDHGYSPEELIGESVNVLETKEPNEPRAGQFRPGARGPHRPHRDGRRPQGRLHVLARLSNHAAPQSRRRDHARGQRRRRHHRTAGDGAQAARAPGAAADERCASGSAWRSSCGSRKSSKRSVGSPPGSRTR